VCYCYDKTTNTGTLDPALGDYTLATRLTYNRTIDFFDGRYEGKLPAQLCDGVAQPDIAKLLLTANFRIAGGIQYDRGEQHWAAALVHIQRYQLLHAFEVLQQHSPRRSPAFDQ
jgi:hypothetical protein